MKIPYPTEAQQDRAFRRFDGEDVDRDQEKQERAIEQAMDKIKEMKEALDENQK